MNEPWKPVETAPLDGTKVDLWVRSKNTEFFFRAADCYRDVARKEWWKDSVGFNLSEMGWEPLFWAPAREPPNFETIYKLKEGQTP
jgi:hypothetical protein